MTAMTIDAIQATELQHQVPLYTKREIALVRGEGAYLYDSDGKRYLDAMSNYGVASLGHADPDFAAAMSNQLDLLTTCHQSFYSDVRAEAIAAILAVSPPGLSRVFLTNSGAESIETGLKFARAATQRTQFVAARRGYHGRTLGALSATADPKYRAPFEPLPMAVEHVPFNDVAALEASISESTAAVILEPIQGEAGIFPGNTAWLQAAREITAKRGALLIVDEVQTGFRTGVPYAISAADVTPDIICTAKTIGNGFPVGCTIVTEAVSEAIPSGAHGTTFGGNPLACRAIVTTLNAFAKRDLYAQSVRIGDLLQNQIRAIESAKIRDVRGRGLMIGVELKERVTPTLRALQERGVLVLPASPVVFRLLPPLIWQEEQVDEFVAALADALA